MVEPVIIKSHAQRGALNRLAAGLKVAEETGLLVQMEGELPPGELEHLREVIKGISLRQDPKPNLPRWRVSLAATVTVTIGAWNEAAALRTALALQDAGKLDWRSDAVRIDIDRRASYADLENDENEATPGKPKADGATPFQG